MITNCKIFVTGSVRRYYCSKEVIFIEYTFNYFITKINVYNIFNILSFYNKTFDKLNKIYIKPFNYDKRTILSLVYNSHVDIEL